MKESRLWTREEAMSETAKIFDAAERTPQHVLASNGRFTITFEKLDYENNAELFSKPGPLEKDDIGDI
jgi:hypothetical protein